MCSRELKFRCWWDNRMHYVEEIDFKRKRVDLLGADTISIEECILMQYTGLKDKNGKEVYEGDLIKIEYEEKYGIVKWNEELACFQICNVPSQTLKHIKYYEIIGNIYENKELLEEGE